MSLAFGQVGLRGTKSGAFGYGSLLGDDFADGVGSFYAD